MADSNEIEHIVERIVSHVLQGHFTQMRDDLVRRVLQELPFDLGPGSMGESMDAGPAELLRAVSTIHAGTTQKEILRALLEGVSHHCGRTALFVMKGSSSIGWQGRGFDDNDRVKDFPLDTSRGLPQRVLQDHAAFTGQTIDMDPRFVDHFGSPADEHILMLPLLLKEKVAALLYADSGLEGGRRLDSAAIELLVVSTSAWLELISVRKQAPREAGGYPENPSPSPPVQTISSFSDPFAGHSPRHAAAVAAAPAYQYPTAREAVESEVVAGAPPAQTDASPGGAVDALSEEEVETHRKAQRFARLLVDEIKLYNQAKVAEGRKHKDLYDRLREDIEKSRATYRKRYGNTVAANTDYFQAELVRSLAEDDISIMGASFRR